MRSTPGPAAAVRVAGSSAEIVDKLLSPRRRPQGRIVEAGWSNWPVRNEL
jgi:hypothetical protein